MKRKEQIQKLLQKKPKVTVVESPRQSDEKPALHNPIRNGKEESFSNTPETQSSQPSQSDKPVGFLCRFLEDKKNRDNYEECSEKLKQRVRFNLGKQLEDKIAAAETAMKREGQNPENIRNEVNEIRKTAETRAKNIMRIRCFICGSRAHKARECEQNPCLQSYGTCSLCYCCGSYKHFFENCPRKSEYMDCVVCFMCEKKGHYSRDCPKKDEEAFPLGGESKNCDAKDNLAEGCQIPDEKKAEDEVTLPTINDVIRTAGAKKVNKKIKSSKPKAVSF